MKICWLLWHIITQRVIHWRAFVVFFFFCNSHEEIAPGFLSSTLISDIRTQIKEEKKKKRPFFLVRCHLYSSPLVDGDRRRCTKMNFNDYQLMMPEDSLLALQFPSWSGHENTWKRPPRCCSARWARDAMIMYSPGVGSCLWKMLVLGEDGLALFERQAAGGTDALIFQQGYSCGASWLFSA